MCQTTNAFYFFYVPRPRCDSMASDLLIFESGLPHAPRRSNPRSSPIVRRIEVNIRNQWFLVFAFLLAFPSTISAYVFDDQCTVYDTQVTTNFSPNLLFMIDKSGSMNRGVDVGGTWVCTLSILGRCFDGYWTPSKWDAASTCIEEVVNDLAVPGPCPTGLEATCDPVRFGLATFSSDGMFRQMMTPTPRSSRL
jgi:hypothetical protein